MCKQFLIIDTSGPDSFVALWKEGALKTELLPPLNQSQALLPAIQALLQDEAIDFIAIGTGPGSFTGTRVGVMTAKTLAYAKKLPLLPFCSLKVYTPDTEGPFTIRTDAKSNKDYILAGIRTKEGATFEPPTIGAQIEAVSSPLNLPFLGHYLLEKFLKSEALSEEKIEVCYLKSP